MWMPILSPAEQELATTRSDFMKRWFAIAISVGFATALSNMGWLKNGDVFDLNKSVDWDQVRQGARLTAAAFATILSWDGYFHSIRNKPLLDGRRFGMDVFLVFLYLLLLLTSKFSYFWLIIHALAFLIYCIWDFFSIRKFPKAYLSASASDDYEPTTSEIYRGTLKVGGPIRKGPAITLMWPLYFWALPLTYFFVVPETHRERPLTTFVYAAFVIYGLFSYRRDKKQEWGTWHRLRRISVSILAVLAADLIIGMIC